MQLFISREMPSSSSSAASATTRQAISTASNSSNSNHQELTPAMAATSYALRVNTAVTTVNDLYAAVVAQERARVGGGLDDLDSSCVALYHGNRRLGRGGRSLASAGVGAGSVVRVGCGGVGLSGGLMIKVRTLTGKEIEIDIEPTDTTERIKERVEEKEGIPPVQQRLIFAGKQMGEGKTAKDYNIEGGTVLHLVLALRGGK